MENRFLRLIEILTRHDVRFIVVGGVAAVLQRVPINTQDFDLVHDRAKDNVARLLLALAELGAVYAGYRIVRLEASLVVSDIELAVARIRAALVALVA